MRSRRGTAWLRSRAALTPAGARRTESCRSVTCYLELVAVVDEAAAAQNAFGRWVAAARSRTAQLLGWAVRTHELDDVADRLDLTIGTGSRATRSGQVLRWRLAGIEQAAAEPSLPFFIEWAPGTPTSRVALRHATRPAPYGWRSCRSTATPIASPRGSALTTFRSPSARGRRKSQASSSRRPRARSGCNRRHRRHSRLSLRAGEAGAVLVEGVGTVSCTVALAGNPNCGETALCNRLTGARQGHEDCPRFKEAARA